MNFFKTLQQYVDRKLVHLNTSNGLTVVKYKNRVFYDNLWDEFLEYCRGLVIDIDNQQIVSVPFTKIYNYGIDKQSLVLDDSTPVFAQRKVNGFLAVISVYNGELLCSTTGSLTSEYVGYIQHFTNQHRDQWLNSMQPGYTYMFECVHPDDPHIVVEEIGLYPLAYRKNDIGSEIIPLQSEFSHIPTVRNVEHFDSTIGQLKNMLTTVEHEGFVFYTADGQSGKMKSPYYLAMKMMARKKDILTLDRKRVDEEFYPLLEFVQTHPEFATMSEQDKLQLMRNFYHQ